MFLLAFVYLNVFRYKFSFFSLKKAKKLKAHQFWQEYQPWSYPFMAISFHRQQAKLDLVFFSSINNDNNYIKIDLHVLNITSATRIINNLTSRLPNKWFSITLFSKSYMSKILINVILCLLIKCINKISISSFSFHIANNINKYHGQSNQLISVNTKLLDCKEWASTE